MADRPLLFSAPMVRALLQGRKTQTRRVLKIRGHKAFSEFGPSDTGGYDWHFRDIEKRWHDLRHSELLKRLPYASGDRLYVREHWRTFAALDKTAPRDMTPRPDWVTYEADGELFPSLGRFRQGMHMPRWASRLTLTVTDVRFERLQDCSEADVLAEGCPLDPHYHDTTQDGSNPHMVKTDAARWISPRAWYHRLWNSINGAGAWEANPWVCALTFTVQLGNIDHLEAA